MIPLSLREIAELTNGELYPPAAGDAVVTGSVEFDSRKIGPGGLFVAFTGANVDGHDFAPAAVAAGAVGVLGSRPVPGVAGIVVSDPQEAMGLLARAVLDRLPAASVIGVTGSSGKTSTKDLIAALLARLGPVVAPPGTFNNELGLPYTVLLAGTDTRFLVLEMGSRGVGHIRRLCRIAPPRIGVVVNVGVAHIGEFGSTEAIAAAKAELVHALPPDGLAVLNGDDPAVAAMAAHTAAAIRLVHTPNEITLDERGRPSFVLDPSFGPDLAGTKVTLGLTGVHQAGNALLAAAVARACGLPDQDLPQALAELRLVSSRRMDVFDRADGVTVIDDSYNANPASTAAALRALAAIGQATDPARRTIAVLGYHAELGEAEREGHAEVGALAATLGVDVLIAVDRSAAPILDGAASVRSWRGETVLVDDQEAAIAELRQRIYGGDLRRSRRRPTGAGADVVLVKGSRYRTWDVVDWLRGKTSGGARA